MRVASGLRNLALGVATGSFLLAGAAFAQSHRLAGVNTKLVHEVNSQNAQPGQTIEATLQGSIKADGVDFPRGTELIGKVDRVTASQNGSASKMSIEFTTAKLKDGKQVPVKVLVLGAFPANESTEASYWNEDVGPAPKTVSSREKIDQEPGTLGKIAMTSSALGHASATFTNKDGDIKLMAGTYLQVGIRPANASGTMNSGA